MVVRYVEETVDHIELRAATATANPEVTRMFLKCPRLQVHANAAAEAHVHQVARVGRELGLGRALTG